MQNLSSKQIVFKRPLIDCRVALQDYGEAAGDGPKSRFGLKELQRRAFERGVSVERAKYSRMLSEMLELVKEQSSQMVRGMAADRERMEVFAVGLALQVAENLTRSMVDQEQHDVVKMVQDLLGELDSGTKAKGLTLRLNPKDHAALLDAAANAEINLSEIETLPDSEVAVASPRLSGGDTEYYADLNERLTEIRGTLTEEAIHAKS